MVWTTLQRRRTQAGRPGSHTASAAGRLTVKQSVSRDKDRDQVGGGQSPEIAVTGAPPGPDQLIEQVEELVRVQAANTLRGDVLGAGLLLFATTRP